MVYKEKALKVAGQLRYGDDVIKKILKAKSDSEISRIMVTARSERVRKIEIANDRRCDRDSYIFKKRKTR